MKTLRVIKETAMVLILVSLVSACGGDSDSGEPIDNQRVARGEDLYQENCASCHRPDLSGDPDWKTPNADGSYPPPPHDSSGHTWHHSDQALLAIIRDGSDFPQTRMPSFGDKLTDDDIGAILDYFKANWGPEERKYQRQITEQESQLGN
ncbi:MAG: cytochrome c [Acidimicrobiia bacterium]